MSKQPTLPPTDGPALSAGDGEATIDIQGMTCASCVAHVEKAARAVPGVRECRVNLARGRASVEFDPKRVQPPQIAEAITRAGYSAAPEQADVPAAEKEEQHLRHQHHEARGWFNRALVGTILWLPLEIAHWTGQLVAPRTHVHPAQATAMGWATLIASSIAMLYVGGRFYASAFSALRRRTSNMDTLISMGATVAYGYSLTYFIGGLIGAWPAPMSHDLFFMEATGLLALISIGHWLEGRARQSAGSAIRELLELAPPTAQLLKGGPSPGMSAATPVEVPLSTLSVGDLVLVRPGDRVPIDGNVAEGRSNVDESMISGEPIPVARTVGDSVIGGTVNQDGRLVVRVTRTGNQTALAQIVSLVEQAQSSKPPVQRMADQISAVFVPSVLLIALATGIGWYFWGMHMHWSAGQNWAHITRAVCSVLIIACPCALGLAVPATVMVATGIGAARGILIRDVDALQKAEKIQIVVLDKTGTITAGKPVASDILPMNGMTGDEVLRLAASAEQFSSHPLARAIVAAARARGGKFSDVAGFSSVAGGGVVAEIDGASLLVGSDAFLRGQGVVEPNGDLASATPGSTFVHVARRAADGTLARLGTIVVADQLKPDSAAAIATLHRMNLRTVLLSGDNRAAAESIARQVGIDEVRAEVTPAGKAEAIRSLQAGTKGAAVRRVAMVGDGINDAPALAAADLGIAVGGGSDIAREAGDIVLVSGSLATVPAAIRLSVATMRKMRQNLFLAFIYNVIAIPLAAFGLLSPLIAAAAMALSDVTVLGNALLLRRENIG